MRAVVQRASRAKVVVDGSVTGEIGRGLVVLLGVSDADSPTDALFLAEKVAQLRVFSDSEGKMNLSIQEVQGAVLAVSQFTLLGDCRRGRRPSYTRAARPEEAERLYISFVEQLRTMGLKVETGLFGAMMEVELVNDGPVTLLLDSTKLF